MATFWIHSNDGKLNMGIGEIRADYVVNNNGVMTFHNADGLAIVWYVLLPGEMMTADYQEI